MDNIPGYEALRLRYLRQMAEHEAVFADCILACQGTDAKQTMEALTQAHVFLHRILGSAGSFGFPTLGDAARACDAAITVYIYGEADLTQDARADLIEKLRAFEQARAEAVATLG